MRNLEKGQHIFIAFQNGKAVLDSQLRPRMYTSLENADRWTPTVNKGKIEYVEYAPTLTPPNEALTLGLVDKYGAPLYAGDTVAADKFFMYAIRYGSHNVNPKQCEPAYQVGWYLEIVWALYNEDKTYIGHTEALYDIGGVAARYPAHCADTTEGVQNLLLYKHRPPEVSP